MSGPPEEVRALAERRAEARAAKDFVAADVLRARIAEAGWFVLDDPQGWRLEPQDVGGPAGPVRAVDVASLLEEPPSVDVSVHWICEGWPEDIARGIASFRRYEGGRAVRYVVADVSGADATSFGDDVEVLALERGTGWAAACNAGLRHAAGALVFAMDGSIEVTGDVFSPLESALGDPLVGIAGPYGILTQDLRQFDDAPRPGPCDAIEGYFLALRRATLTDVGLFDEKFRWYRTADIEYSFRVKDHGLSTVMVGVPVERHEHRMWFNTDPAERAKWSKRNYYRFLDRWRDRWDLVLDPHPPHNHHHDEH